MGAIDGVLVIGQAAAIAAVVNGAFIEHRELADVGGWIVALAVVVVVRALAGWAREELGAKAGALLRTRIRNELARRLVDGGPTGRESLSDGELATVAIEQVEALEDYVAKYLPQRVLAGLVPGAIILAVLPHSWVGALILLLTAPVIPLFAWLIGLGAAEASQRQFAALGRLGALFVDRLRGLPTLKLFGRVDDEVETLRTSTEDYRKRTMSVLKIAFLSSAVLELFSAIGLAMMAVYLGFTLMGQWNFGFWSQTLTFHVALYLLILAADFYLPLRALGSQHHARQAALGASTKLRAVFETLEREGGRESVQQVTELSELAPIRFEEVSVLFGEKQAALSELSLTIEPGEQLAIVGRSGAGKSTLLSLLLGNRTPSAGQVTVGGRRLSELDLESWRRLIAWVGQQPTLFHGTLRSNITLGSVESSDDDVEAAARAARVTEFSRELPLGLDSEVGEEGVGLSGGQIQRVALARAYFRGAPLLILDEPTANLDSESEELVLDALTSLARGKTMVLVTHRLRACRGVDRVVVLEQGRVLADGPPEEVLDVVDEQAGDLNG